MKWQIKVIVDVVLSSLLTINQTIELYFATVNLTLTGYLVLVSGKEGKFLQKVATPHQEETYYAPQVLVHLDGVSIVVFGTGGQASPGGLYAVPLLHLVKGNMLQVRLIASITNMFILIYSRRFSCSFLSITKQGIFSFFYT
jgi:hypothetical protein